MVHERGEVRNDLIKDSRDFPHIQCEIVIIVTLCSLHHCLTILTTKERDKKINGMEFSIKNV